MINQVDDKMDERVTLDTSLTRRDWRTLLRAAERECIRLSKRSRRPTSQPNGADARTLAALRHIVILLATASGETDITNTLESLRRLVPALIHAVGDPYDTDARMLKRLQQIVPVLTRASGNEL